MGRSAMEASDGSLADIRRYFTTLLEATSLPIGRLGCLICNTAVELAPLEGPIAGKVAAHLARMTAAFHNALTNARQRGEVSAELDIDVYTDYLTGVALGLMTGSRAALERDALRRFIDVALMALG
jgi:TetR/AcrR family transcriptional regulator, transcriptional repressor for nem operon